MEPVDCVTLNEMVLRRGEHGYESSEVVEVNRWRMVSLALVPVTGLTLLLRASGVFRGSDAFWVPLWCLFLIAVLAAGCLPSHRSVWRKTFEGHTDFQAWFDECKSADDLAYAHDVTGDIVADCGTNTSPALFNEVAGYEHTVPDALGDIATSLGWFDEHTVRIAP